MTENGKKTKALDEEYFETPATDDYFHTETQSFDNVQTNDDVFGDIYDEQPQTNVKLGMKWYKFLIYFALWAGAVLNFLNAIAMLTGSIYEAEGVPSWYVYEYYPQLQRIDLIFGILLIALSVHQLTVRSSLAKFKADAPKKLKLMYVYEILWEIAYTIIVSNVIGTGAVISEIISSCIVSVVMILINDKYFKNRKHLFVN